MGNSKVVSRQGGTRSKASGSTSFLLKQSREPYGSIPKTNYAFQQWLIENDYLSRLANNAIDSTILYQQLHDQFFGKCGGGDGTLLFGVQVFRKNRDLLDRASAVRLRSTWGYLKLRQTRNVEETILVDVNNEDTITVSDYYITGVVNAPWVGVRRGTEWLYRGTPPGKWTYGGVYDSDGERLTRIIDLVPTNVVFSDEGTLTITFPGKRVGTYEIILEHEFDDYVLTLPPRDLGTGQDIFDPTKVYDSTVLGFGAGDYISMPIEVPDSAADCIPYAQILDPETGEYITVIKGSDTHLGYDSNGDGKLDGGAEIDDCICWMCDGTGVLPDCVETDTINCTCPTCQGTGILPACQEDEESDTNNTYYNYYNYGDTDPSDDGTDKPYTLEVDEHMCTGEVVDYELRKN